MVEATLKRSLLEPVQATQSPDIIVFQNGVLNLTEVNAVTAWTPDLEAPLKYSHAVWSYFDVELWNQLVKEEFHLISGRNEKPDRFSRARSLCRELVPVFSKYMEDWFPKDRAAFEIVLRWFGYSMTTDTRQQKFVFFYGPTRAGKGSLARLLCGLVGSNNYSSANYCAFEDKFQATGMHDRLVVTMEEVEATPKEHEKRLGMMKKYLGGERVVWENKYEHPFEDIFVGKLIMQSNEVLAYEDKGRSVTARMIPLEFKMSFDGSGEEQPEKVIFDAGEGNAISTLASMMWYRMRRNRVRGAFDFKHNENWSINACKACQHGKNSLLLENHKALWPFLVFFKGEMDGLNEQLAEGRLVKCTRNNLRELTEKLLEISGKKPLGGNVCKLFRDAVKRDFPESKEIQCRIADLGRERGWKGLFIDAVKLKREYPEVFKNINQYESQSLRLLD